MKSYFESVNYLRGIAALGVTFAHMDVLEALKLPLALKALGSLSQECVIVFFVISGFVLPMSLSKGQYHPRKFLTFLQKRLIRIEPIYVISVAVAAALLYFQSRHHLYPGDKWTPTLGEIGAHFLYLIPFTDYNWINPVFWTLAIEFQYYIFLAVTFPLLLRWVGSKRIGVSLMASSLSVLPPLLFPGYSSLANFSPIFMLGFVVFLEQAQLISRKSFYLNGTVLLVLFAITNRPSLALAAATGALLIIFWNPGRTRLSFLGDISFSLYVFHGPVVFTIMRGGIIFFDSSMAHTLLWITALLTAVLVAWIAFRTIESRCIKASKRFRY